MIKLTVNPDNPRTIDKKDFEKLKKSVQSFTKMLEIRPIAYDENKVIWGGNQRYVALEMLVNEGLIEPKDEYFKEMVGYTLDEKKEFAIRDNIEYGKHDWDILMGSDTWADAPLDEWGLDPTEWTSKEVIEDEAPEVSDEPAVSRRGEIYQLGKHRVMCGDSTKIEDVEKLMDGKKADMVFTDPPYGIGYDDNMWEGIRGYDIESKRMGMIRGDDKPYDPSFLLETFKYVKEMFIWGFQFYPEKLGRGGVVAWIKKTDAQKNMLHGDFELCWSKQERNKMFLFPWGGFNNKERSEGERWHPTQKPVGIIDLMMRQWGKEKDVVVDPFLGSGSTLIACEQTNRICYGMELDEKYLDVVRKRWAKYVYPDRWEDEWQTLTPSIDKL